MRPEFKEELQAEMTGGIDDLLSALRAECEGELCDAMFIVRIGNHVAHVSSFDEKTRHAMLVQLADQLRPVPQDAPKP